MLQEHVEKLKQQYTDQYVVADPARPELVRFQNVVGQIKTINMNGRALVQFDVDNNRGWYDIDLAYLKVVDKPPPKPEPPRVTPKAATAKAAQANPKPAKEQ